MVNNHFLSIRKFFIHKNSKQVCRSPLTSLNRNEIHNVFLFSFTVNSCKFPQWYISVQFSCSVVSESLQTHGLQQASLPCASPTPGAHSDSRPSSQWCRPTISSSVISLASLLQCFPASGSFLGSSHQVAKVLEFQL